MYFKAIFENKNSGNNFLVAFKFFYCNVVNYSTIVTFFFNWNYFGSYVYFQAILVVYSRKYSTNGYICMKTRIKKISGSNLLVHLYIFFIDSAYAQAKIQWSLLLAS